MMHNIISDTYLLLYSHSIPYFTFIGNCVPAILYYLQISNGSHFALIVVLYRLCFLPENLKSFLFQKDFRITERLQRWYRGYQCTFTQFFSPDLIISHSVVHLSKLGNQRFYLEFLFSFRLPANKYYHIFCETGVFCSMFQSPLVDFHTT